MSDFAMALQIPYCPVGTFKNRVVIYGRLAYGTIQPRHYVTRLPRKANRSPALKGRPKML